MTTLNDINSDESLGDGFEIGHSYFCSYKSGNIINGFPTIKLK